MAKSKKGTEAHSSGTTYTPGNVVQYLVNEAFSRVRPDSGPTVYDPACGSGHFLVEAVRVLSKKIDVSVTSTDNLVDHSREIVTRFVYGNDKNELAAKLCRLMLAIETAKRGFPVVDLRKNIRSFDSLFVSPGDKAWNAEFGPGVRDGFDYVIGNPPYVRADEPGQKDYRAEIKGSGRYTWLHKKWDLFIPFIEMGVKLVSKRSGVLAFVVGDGVTYAPYSEICIDELSKSGCVRFVSHFDEPFEGWAFAATCFVYDCLNKKEAERRMHKGNDPAMINERDFVKNAFLSPRKAAIGTRKQAWDGLVLGDIAYISVGMVLNAHENLNPPNGSFKKSDLIIQADGPDKDHPVKLLENEDIVFGRLQVKKPHFIEYGPGLSAPEYIRRPTFPELHEGDRILLSSSYKGRAAARVDDCAVVSHCTIVIRRWLDLKKVDNRSIDKKAQECAKRFPGKAKDIRKFLEEISKEISTDLLAGILNSNYFIKWVNDDKRHKYCVVPDVVSEMPLPFRPRNATAFVRARGADKKPKVRVDGLAFSRELDRLKKSDLSSSDTTAMVIDYIEEIARGLSRATSNQNVHMIEGYLDALVELLYTPLLAKDKAAA